MSSVIIKNILSQSDLTSLMDMELPVFAKEGYLKAKSSSFGWLVSDSFILPYIIVKKLIFKRLIFTSTPIRLLKASDEQEALFLSEAINFLKENKLCDFIGKAQSNCVFKNVPEHISTVPWGSYLLDLTKSEDEIISGYHKKHRNVVKKAEKEGASVVFNDSIDVVYNNIKETLDRQNAPYFPSLDFLTNLKKDIPDNLLLASVYQNEILQGTAVILFDGECGYYLYGGSTPRPATGSVNYLQHRIMLHLKSLGLSKYDFVGARITVQPGSKFEGIQRFKSRFGCQLETGYAFNVIFSPIKFKLYNFTAKLYLRLKGIEYKDPIEELLKVPNK
ncbi:lipid II:glycine glycyltransferase FemX [Psychromonas hadalis]|uniref:lipid II:glycine glycyltransferase FemX n=1 Tax=Psychromonas hadalis TaxID=211669 RepID=UPI000423BB85|nr:peptidoglycan bridge formation glycyltransferase FemA/FemB family protein [Psychromonas hadalis]